MTAYYKLLSQTTEADGEVRSTYMPNIHAQGAWNEDEQHMGPASGLLAAEIARFMPRDDLRIGRISYDILGMIHFSESTIQTRLLRPGKTIELVEAQMITKGRVSIVARAWRMLTQDTQPIAAIEDQPMPGPDFDKSLHGQLDWPGGFIQSLSIYQGAQHRAGKGQVWLNTDINMIEGQQDSDLVHLIGLLDTANGIAHRQLSTGINWAFPNLDVQLHMYRQPQGRWLGLDATQQYGSDGIGLTSAILHDEQGPFGRSEQILTVRPLPAPL